jgi:type II secretory pathway pseudopilin PulG
MKGTSGFSYIEIIVSLALFSIALVAVLPVLSQASRNLAYAQDVYAAQLRAHNLLFIVRDALTDGHDPEPAARQYSQAREGFPFTVHITGGTGGDRGFSTPDAPTALINVNDNAPSFNQTVITVIVWNEHSHIAARIVGIK